LSQPTVHAPIAANDSWHNEITPARPVIKP
jgi:hypothetical protein